MNSHSDEEIDKKADTELLDETESRPKMNWVKMNEEEYDRLRKKWLKLFDYSL